MRKKLIALSLVCLTLASVYGCSSNDAKKDAKDENLSSTKDTVADVKENGNENPETDNDNTETDENDGKIIIEGFEVEQDGDGYTIINYVGDEEKITIPKELNGVPVTTIYARETYTQSPINETIKTIAFEEGIEVYINTLTGWEAKYFEFPSEGKITFGESCCRGCRFVELNFNESVEKIETHAFDFNESLTTVTFDVADGFELKDAFNDCIELKSVDFGDATYSYIDISLCGNTAVEELNFPNVEEGMYTSFDSRLAGSLLDMKNLKSVTFKTGTIDFAGGFVKECPSFEKIDFGTIEWKNSAREDGSEFFWDGWTTTGLDQERIITTEHIPVILVTSGTKVGEDFVSFFDNNFNFSFATIQ